MSRKIIPPFAVLLILTAACKQGGSSEESGSSTAKSQRESESFVLTGRLKHAQDSSEKLYFRPFHRYIHYTIQLDSAGRFEKEFSLSQPLYLTFLEQKLFVRPGDSLHIEGDMKKDRKSLAFSGDLEKENRYLSEKAALEDSLKGFSKKIYRRSPEAFIKGLDSVHELNKELLASRDLPSDQVGMEKERMKWEKAYKRLRYKTIHSYLTKQEADSVDLPENFYDPLQDLQPEAGPNISIPIFYRYLDKYAYHLAEQKREEDSASMEAPLIQLEQRLIEDRYKNDTVQTVLLAKNLFNKLQRDGVEHTKPLLKELDKSSLFSELTDSLKARADDWEPIAAGKEAPGFSYPSIDGDTVSLEELSGEHVYIDAWATWCGPCKKEIPHLKELEQQFKDDPVTFVSISLDDEQMMSKWKSMVKEKELGGHQLFANGNAFDSKLAKDYLINSIPRFILIGPDGKIIDNNAERPSGEAEEQLRKEIKG